MALTPGAADPEDKKIEIVGAGLAGLVCAIVLAKVNRRVVVRERHEDVGHRFRDDFQRLENWTADGNVPDELAEAGVAADFDHFGVTDGVVFDSRATAHRVHGSQPLFYLLRRGNATGTLDRALLDRARAAGVEVRFNDRVKRTAGNMILAGRPRRADLIAVGYVFDTTMADGAWLAFGAEIASKGYAYLLVHQGRGAVASYMFSGFHDQAEYLAATVSYFKRHAGLKMQKPRGFGGFRECPIAAHGDAGWKPGDGRTRGPRGIDYLVGKLGSNDTDVLGQAYRLSLPMRLLLPFARFHYRNPLQDRSCSHNNCNCVWCQHGAHEVADT